MPQKELVINDQKPYCSRNIQIPDSGRQTREDWGKEQ
jgi:hypothetical protein